MVSQEGNQWRKAYEFNAAIGWIVALVFMFLSATAADLPTGPFWYMAVVALFFIVMNLISSWEIWSVKMALGGIGIEFMRIEALQEIAAQNPGKIWLGRGFEWKSEHTQRVYELKKVNPEDCYPPEAFLRFKEKFFGQKVASIDPDSIGAPWIHGVEPKEVDNVMALDNLIGNTLIVGTTRCGKTRLLDVMISQFIFLPGQTIIVVDPKGDKELRDNMRRAARVAGREKDFCEFSLASPSSSIRIDPLKNYNNITELASRVSALMPSSGDSGDSFTSFAWKVSNAIFLGMVASNEKPTIRKLRQYVESGVDGLLAKCLPAFFIEQESKVPDWRKKTAEYISRSVKRDKDNKMPDREPNSKEILGGYLKMYESLYRDVGIISEAIDSLTNIFHHDVGHYGKMVTTFEPVLAMLSTGEIGDLLSPDSADIEDDRLATDMLKLTDSGSIVYVGLNALADKTVAGAVGAMLLSDLAAVAAMRYNFRTKAENDSRRVYLVVDEAAQVVNDPYIQILNMAGGSGYVNIAATQTIPDFSARLGNEEKARQMLGNFNNLIALRSKDRTTQDFITETFGDTYVKAKQTTHATSSTTEKNISHFGGTIAERVGESLEAVFPTDLLGKMPNWQYIASVSGGRLVKGRVPILKEVG